MIVDSLQQAPLPVAVGAVIRVHSRRGDPFIAVRIHPTSAMPWHVVQRGSRMSDEGLSKYPIIEVLQPGVDIQGAD